MRRALYSDDAGEGGSNTHVPFMSSLLVGRGGAVLATASAMVSEVGVLGVCVACVAEVVGVSALVVRRNDYRSDDQAGALVVICMDRSVGREGGRLLSGGGVMLSW
jgi:hypothetical protein